MIADAPAVTAVRDMVPGDVPAVAALEDEVDRRPWSPEVLRTELDRDDRVYTVAVAAGVRVVGYAALAVVADEGHVLTVVVAPDQRRQGIGRQLVQALLTVARARGLDAATLEVRASNDAAHALYRGLGFVSEGIRPGYYQDDSEDARILWLRGLRDRADAGGRTPTDDEES